MQTNRPRILVVGSVNMDYVFQIPHFPQAGETTLCQKHQCVSGGKGANQAVAAARFDSHVEFFCSVGCDANGETLKNELEQSGVSTRFCQKTAEHPTGLAAIFVEAKGENRIVVSSGANSHLNPTQLTNVFQKTYDAVLIQFEIEWDTIATTCQIAGNKGIPVVIDAGPVRPFPLAEVTEMEIFSPNQHEAEVLAQVKIHSLRHAQTAAEILQKQTKARYVVIKLGSNGALLYHKGTAEHFPAHSVNVVDTTAAGDAFTAALTVEYVRQRDIRQAIVWANAAGALATTKIGAQLSLPWRNDVEQLVDGKN